MGKQACGRIGIGELVIRGIVSGVVKCNGTIGIGTLCIRIWVHAKACLLAASKSCSGWVKRGKGCGIYRPCVAWILKSLGVVTTIAPWGGAN